MIQSRFLNFFTHYPLASFSLLKRAFRQLSLKEIKTLLKESENLRLIQRHSYSGFDCFSLTTFGFANIHKTYSPFSQLTKPKAQLICAVNNLRYGANQEISAYDKIQMEKWLDSRELAEFPLVVRQGDKIQGICPQGLMIIKAGKRARAYFIHYWRTLKQIRKDLALYSVCGKTKDYEKRFLLPDNSALRVLCLIPNVKIFEDHPQIKDYKGAELSLFFPFSKAHYTNPLSSNIWLDAKGGSQRILTL